MILDTLAAALQATSIPFADTAWSTAPESTYGVYQVDFGGRSLWGDGSRIGQVIHGSVDVFVIQGDSVSDARATVETALSGIDSIGWAFESKQFERDTKLTHLEWVWESVDV